MADLDARARNLAAEVAGATQEAAALREDASAAASRADEARRHLAALEKETAQLSSQADMLRATKAALDSELSGLRHEVETVRGRTSGVLRGDGRRESAASPASAPVVARDGEDVLPQARRSRETMRRVEDDGGVVYGGDAEGGNLKGASRDGRGGDHKPVGGYSSGGGGTLVEIVADFQGRLRRQVQAALADDGGSVDRVVGRSDTERSSRSPLALVDAVRLRQAGECGAALLRPGHTDVVFAGRGGSCRDVLGELGRRVGGV